MRKARGNLDQISGYFHLENSLLGNVASLNKADTFVFRGWLAAEAEAAGLRLIFWHFHSRGFGVLVEKPALEASSQPSDFAKRLKQRIARRHNQRLNRRGTIWRDRTKLFHIPDTPPNRLEVAAFLMARPKLESGEDAFDWPSTVAEAQAGEAPARQAVAAFFGEPAFRSDQLTKLLTHRQRILEMAAKPLRTPGRGRHSEWRPACERPGQANTEAEPPGLHDYHAGRKAARQRFYERLSAYEDCCRQIGESRIPRGYPGTAAIRQWAAGLRGKHRSGRLPDWQRDALRGTTVLEPVKVSGGPAPLSTAWLRGYDALRQSCLNRQRNHAPTSKTEQRKIARWLERQRTAHRKGELHPEKIVKLEALGIDFPPVEKNEQVADDNWRLPDHLL